VGYIYLRVPTGVGRPTSSHRRLRTSPLSGEPATRPPPS
jgi:hypothetical protein